MLSDQHWGGEENPVWAGEAISVSRGLAVAVPRPAVKGWGGCMCQFQPWEGVDILGSMSAPKSANTRLRVGSSVSKTKVEMEGHT